MQVKAITVKKKKKKKYIYTCQKILYYKLTYCDHFNKNVEYYDLRIGFNKNKSNATFTIFLQ